MVLLWGPDAVVGLFEMAVTNVTWTYDTKVEGNLHLILMTRSSIQVSSDPDPLFLRDSKFGQSSESRRRMQRFNIDFVR